MIFYRKINSLNYFIRLYYYTKYMTKYKFMYVRNKLIYDRITLRMVFKYYQQIKGASKVQLGLQMISQIVILLALWSLHTCTY